MYVHVFHNILWSKYKGEVFSQLHAIKSRGDAVRFTHVARTEADRKGLGDVDIKYHRYPFEVIFDSAYSEVARWRRVLSLIKRGFETDAQLVVLPGYDKAEYWALLVVSILRRKKRAVFCDSTQNDRPRGNRFKEYAKRVFFRNCDGFFCYGVRSGEYVESFGIDRKKVFVGCQAAALPLDYNAEIAIATRAAGSAYQSASKVFLYVGRLSEEKGIVTLLRAFVRYCTETGDDSTHLRIVGEGPLRSNLICYVQQFRLAGRVDFVGGLSGEALQHEYERATVTVLPSTSEPWGLVINESLSFGCPVIVSDICGCVPELVTPKTGTVFQAGNEGMLSDALRRMAEFNTAETAAHCIEHMRIFTPAKAAEKILLGCEMILDDDDRYVNR